MIAPLRAWWLRVRLKRACNVIRRESGRLGISVLADSSDAELVSRCELFGSTMERACETMESHAWALRAFGNTALTLTELAEARRKAEEPTP